GLQLGNNKNFVASHRVQRETVNSSTTTVLSTGCSTSAGLASVFEAGSEHAAKINTVNLKREIGDSAYK
ncbi:MAG: hypothetical protein ABF322_09390, partial [Lentimonas sp.]